MNRGEVWWADLPRPVGSRPAVVLTRDAVFSTIDGIVVAIVTRTVRNLPTEALLGRQQGLPVRCVANFDSLLTMPRDRFKRLMGACDLETIPLIDRAIRVSLDVKQAVSPAPSARPPGASAAALGRATMTTHMIIPVLPHEQGRAGTPLPRAPAFPGDQATRNSPADVQVS